MHMARPMKLVLTCTVVLIVVGLLLALPTPLAAGEESPTVEGRLLDPQGEPVTGAHVAVLDDGEAIGEAESNPDGSFLVDLERLPQHSVVVHIQRPHFEDQEWRGTSEAIVKLENDNHLYVSDLTMERRVTVGFWVATLTFVGLLVLIAIQELIDVELTGADRDGEAS